MKLNDAIIERALMEKVAIDLPDLGALKGFATEKYEALKDFVKKDPLLAAALLTGGLGIASSPFLFAARKPTAGAGLLTGGLGLALLPLLLRGKKGEEAPVRPLTEKEKAMRALRTFQSHLGSIKDPELLRAALKQIAYLQKKIKSFYTK